MRGERMLARGRQVAEARMSETVTFYTESKSEDPITLQPVVLEEVVATVRARVKASGRSARDVATAGQEPVVSPLEVHVSYGSVDVGPSVLVRVETSVADPGLIGARYRTTDFPTKGQSTAWRYPVEQVS